MRQFECLTDEEEGSIIVIETELQPQRTQKNLCGLCGSSANSAVAREKV